MARKPAKSSKVSLIVSEDKDVRLKARPGAKMHVVQVESITPDLKKAARIGARLCGYGSNMCIAIIDIEK
ncbi:MAG: hypothetical protein Q7J60_16505 [Bradyrhizobium sp.]|uniref:hypothetical protein n=1 Tax=Bradyrhizobium sp. TaxID=376 RepID=UPI002719C6AB|nr:hypothetical protein [Bradyrhizobium sp.]MDO9563219.1 hypothetical protein [Bradyrhizobium sp.]MDP3689557.1 hypothetical protein [Bradyrhizobium sp.]